MHDRTWFIAIEQVGAKANDCTLTSARLVADGKMVRFWERSSDAPLKPSMSERMPRRWVSARTNITIRLILITAVTVAWANEKIMRASESPAEAERPTKPPTRS